VQRIGQHRGKGLKVKKAPRLGVNIDHVATVRNARGEYYPEIARAAETVLLAGAEQITIHLREDRRHIVDADVAIVKNICQKHKRLFNLEIGNNKNIVEIALAHHPDWICLVPESRQERTTEGGLNLKDDQIFKNIKNVCEEFKAKTKTKISLFVEADIKTLERASTLQIDAVEIHTGAYAKKFLDKKTYSQDLQSFVLAHQFLSAHKIGFHAGHGLTLESVAPLLQQSLFAEYNIGHFIIAEAIFKGLGPVVVDFKELFNKFSV
jgi:pyridoxine 5-phosphate synthase